MFKNTKYYLWNLIYKVVLEIVYHLYVSPIILFRLIWNPDLYKLIFIFNIYLLLLLPKSRQAFSSINTIVFYNNFPVAIYWQTGQEWNYMF